MLYFIGLGLFDEKDISIKGLEALKSSDEVYAEFYTAGLFGTSIPKFEELIGRKITILNREDVEEKNIPLIEAETKDVAFLVAGDSLIATTHTDMLMQAKKKGIKTRIMHAGSILSAAPGISGLQAYKFGKVTTIPFPEENYFPQSPYFAIQKNLEFDAHTLVLLDIHAHENKYMTVNEGLKYLLKLEELHGEKIISENTLAVAIARAGSNKPLIRADKIKNLITEDFGGPLHCFIIPSRLHFMEAEYLVEMANAPKEILNDA